MFQLLGQKVTAFLQDLGNITLMTCRVVKHFCWSKNYARRTFDQMYLLGIMSLPVTVVTAAFVGMAFTVQVVNEFLKFGAGEMVGGIVGMAMWRELAPMMTGVVVAGRVGAAISAELGTMKVTEQVEALEAMSQDPVEFLVLPRVLACTLLMPLLVGIADIVGYFGGFFVAIATRRINPYSYINSADAMLVTVDIWGGLVKGLLFGFCIAIISSYMGLKATAGAKGVGLMTTKAVVVSLIVVFVLNYFLSVIIF